MRFAYGGEAEGGMRCSPGTSGGNAQLAEVLDSVGMRPQFLEHPEIPHYVRVADVIAGRPPEEAMAEFRSAPKARRSATGALPGRCSIQARNGAWI